MKKPFFYSLLSKLRLYSPSKEAVSLYELPRDESVLKRRKVIQTLRYDNTDRRKYIMPRDDVLNNPSTAGDYEQMAHDPIIRMALMVARLMPLAQGYTLTPAFDDDDPRHQEASRQLQFIESELPADKTMPALYNLTSAFWDGYSILEEVFDLTDPVQNPDYANLLTLSRLIHRDVSQWGFDVDTEMNVKGLVNTPRNAMRGVSYPVEKFVYYTYDKHFEDPRGKGLKRTLHRAWKYKQQVQDSWGVAASRFGCPPIIGKYDPNLLSEDEQNDFLVALKGIQEDSESAVPIGTEIEVLELKGSGSIDYRSAIQAYNAELVIGAVGASLGMLESEYGTRAQSGDHKSTADTVGEWRQKEIEGVWQCQVIDRLIHANFSDPMPPKFGLNPVNKEDIGAIADVLLKANTLGSIDPMGVDADYVRERLNLDPLEEGVDLYALKQERAQQEMEMQSKFAPKQENSNNFQKK